MTSRFRPDPADLEDGLGCGGAGGARASDGRLADTGAFASGIEALMSVWWLSAADSDELDVDEWASVGVCLFVDCPNGMADISTAMCSRPRRNQG